MNDLFKSVTVEQFKTYYFRDFPFLPVYVENKIYFKGDIVYYSNYFYTSLIDNNTTLPTDTQNWQITNLDKYSYITDADIERAIAQALVNANERFGSDDEEKIIIFLHLVAFYLVMDIKNSSQGIASSYSGMLSSKSVGDVSESYSFPNWVNNNPYFSIYLSNGYGMKYLSLILPYISATILFAPGRSTVG